MRDIKFRFYTPSINKMIYPTAGNFNDLIEDEDWKVMQFTGLKDKNGVEIYEGDIFHCNGVNYVLRFLKLGGAYTVHKVREESNERFLLHCNHQLEVIGNIHQNGEILK